jgi:hypothetical protein
MYLYYIHFFYIFLQGRGTLFFFRGGVLSYICIFITVINYCIRDPCRAGLKLIEQIAPNWAPGCLTWVARAGVTLFSAVKVHTTTHCRFYREQLVPTPHKAGPGSMYPLPVILNSINMITFIGGKIIFVKKVWRYQRCNQKP